MFKKITKKIKQNVTNPEIFITKEEMYVKYSKCSRNSLSK